MKKRLFALMIALVMLLTSGCSLLNKPEKEENDFAQKLEQAMQQAQGENEPQQNKQPEQAYELPEDPMLWTTETEHIANCRMPEVTYGENEGDLSIAWNLDGMALMEMRREKVNEANLIGFANNQEMTEDRFAAEATRWPGLEYYHVEVEVEQLGEPCIYTEVGLRNEEWMFLFEATAEISGGEEYQGLVYQIIEQLYFEDAATAQALAQSAYESGAASGIEAVVSEEYYEYAELLNDLWVAENYADESDPYIWYFAEDGTVLLSYEDYYTYPDHEGSSS